MSVEIQGKVALVTGANRGIGKAIVESFIEHGASKVYLAVRDPESTQDLESEYGDKVVSIQADVSDTKSIKHLATQATDVDIVVNNAGVLVPANPLSDNIEEALQKELDVNVLGLVRVANAFTDALQNNGGALVQLNSVASIKNFTEFSSYSASKAASYSITQGLQEKFLDKGIHVLSVHPGPIGTDMGEQAGFEVSDPASVVSEGIVSALAAGDFHLFPDTVAKHFETAYQGYSDAMITAEIEE